MDCHGESGMTGSAGKVAATGLAFIALATVVSGCGSVTRGNLTGCVLPLVRFVGTSMERTIGDGDLLCTVPVQPSSLQRGDIVVFHPPDNPSHTFVKRIIALPGEVLEIDGNRSTPAVLIKVAGQTQFQLLSEPYLPERWTSETFCCRDNGTASNAASPVAVLREGYFVMGDNRNFSADSRSFGFVGAGSITAVVTNDNSERGIYSQLPTLVPSKA